MSCSPAETDRLLYHMGSVIKHADSDWARNFAMSVLRQSKRRTWQPSPKQLNVMRSLVSDLFRPEQPGDLQLIEE